MPLENCKKLFCWPGFMSVFPGLGCALLGCPVGYVRIKGDVRISGL